MSTLNLDMRHEFLLAPGVSITRSQGSLCAETPAGRLFLPSVSPSVVEALVGLNHSRVSKHAFYESAHRSQDLHALSQLFYILQILAKNQLLYSGIFQQATPLAILRPISHYYEIKADVIRTDAHYGLSRFCYVRRVDQEVLLESPLAYAHIQLCQRRALACIYELACPRHPLALAENTTDFSPEDSLALLCLLIAGGFVSECNADGVVQIDDTPALKQWAFHDLVFHSRSRMGRHNNPLGGTYRFFGEIAPLPAVKPPMSTNKVSLVRPNIGEAIKQDITLTQALEQRVSVRHYGDTPLTLSELSEFLYRAARVKDRYTYQGLEFTRRPYPNGGAIYELELYLTVNRCHGLPSGLYHYDPAEHALFYLSAPNANTEWLLLNAWTATAQTCRPEVLITITARFQRVSWKYESIAYATILKNVGALYQTMYLVATAMNLGPCALGSGNSDLFARTIAEDYYIESSVGEFMLGNRRI